MKRLLMALCAIIISGLSFAANAACTADEIDVLGNGTQCETAKFTLTTVSDTTSFRFLLSAKGTFYVDCGNGGTLTDANSNNFGKTITRLDMTPTTYSCNWGTGAAQTIRFGGIATDYSTSTTASAINFYINQATDAAKIASISGSLGQIFPVATNGRIPRFYQTFFKCSNLTSIPAGIFSGIDTSSVTNINDMFSYTFRDCTSLTSIPDGLFSGIDTSSATNTSSMFGGTFYGCNKLTSIPSDLFSSIDTSSATNTSSMFGGTFYGCNKLTSIPSDLFSGIDTSSATNTSYMFSQTFLSCMGLTSIPSDLFSSIDTSSALNTTQMFSSTFNGCTGLTGAIPSDLFSTIDTSSATNTSRMFGSTFKDCNKLTSIPSDLFSSIDTSSATNTSYMFNETFYGCYKLTSIPDGLFSSIDTSSATDTSYMFYGTFNSCGGLTGAIPAGLFDSIDTSSSANTSHMFYHTFVGSRGLTGAIPSGLFDSIDTSSATNTSYMFTGTFQGCTGLTSIPSDLFSAIDTSSATNTSSMFASTFYGCTGLTSIPENLFSGITTAGQSMFSYIFYKCSNITGYIPSSTFAGLIANGSPKASNMWIEAFDGTQLATNTCPRGTTEYPTGYKWETNGWGGYVSCVELPPLNCSAGEYLPANAEACAQCLAGSYCIGGSYRFNENTTQGITACDLGYSSLAGSDDATDCVGNTITINWDGADAEDIAANNAGTVTYGGDIRTPKKARHINGKIFVGWTFSIPNQ